MVIIPSATFSLIGGLKVTLFAQGSGMCAFYAALIIILRSYVLAIEIETQQNIKQLPKNTLHKPVHSELRQKQLEVY